MSKKDAVEKTLDWKNLKPLAGKSGVLLFGAAMWLFLAFTHRAANYNPMSAERSKHIYIPPIIEHQIGNISKDALLGYNFPLPIQFEKLINRNEASLVYRVGTQLNFFIKKNDRRVLNDTYLDFFEYLVQKKNTKQQIIQILKNEGFEFIVFDLNLANEDYTPNKTLTRKFTNFMNALYDNPSVELVLTDRQLKRHDTGQIVSGIFPNIGPIVQSGKLAVFKIK